jgi:PST family polysaccharide transporter
VIGRYFDIGIVGQYSIAYRLMLFPMKFLSAKVQAVLYPTLSRMKGNSRDLLSFYANVVSYIGFAVFPLMGLASVTAFLWAPWIFDASRYDVIIPLIQWLTIAGAFQAITSPIGSLYMVFNMVRLMGIYSTASALIFILGYGLGAWSGNIVVFAIIYSVLSVMVNFFASNFLPLYRLNFPFGEFLRQTLEPLLPSVAAYAIVCFLLVFPEHKVFGHNQALALALVIFIYASAYIAFYSWWFRGRLLEKISKIKTLIY